jgi:small subunit ribosomal protein S6
MLLTEYETTVVMRPDIGGDLIEATLDRVRNAVADGGKLIAINHWGKKRLAYEVERHTRGVYVHTHYLGGGGLVAEIERNLRLSENVLRFLTVRLADGIEAETRETVAYVQPAYDAADAPEEEEAEAPFAHGEHEGGDDHRRSYDSRDGDDGEPDDELDL